MKKHIYFVLIFCVAIAHAQKDKKITNKTVSKSAIDAHLKFLSSDALRGRDTPSQGLEVAAEYLKTRLEKYGVKAFEEYPDYFQPVPMQKIMKASQGEITIDTAVFDIDEDFILLRGLNVDWNGSFIFLDNATKEELEEADVEGKVVITNPGDGQDDSPRTWFRMISEKRENAAKAGAVGLIELYNSPQIPWQLLVRYLSGDKTILDKGEEDEGIPFIWLNNPGRQVNKALEGNDQLSMSISGAAVEKFVVHNVVGYVEGTDSDLKEEFIALSAHYDHVGVGQPDSTGDAIYNGARDNAVGTVTVLEAAKNLAKYPTKRSSIFVLFAGEEKGLLGSEWFVEHSPLALEKIIFAFNSDNGGYNNTDYATIIGLNRTTAKDEIVTAVEAFGLKANDDPAPEQGLFDRSDNVNFAKKGIPAPSFGMGFDAFDEEIMKTYHQPSDEFETMDMEYLNTFYRTYVLAARMIGNMKETPFWVEGDKYYDAGKGLYDK